MAIGLISSPATWNVGTVVAPAWAQGVQDNVNGLIAGTGPSLAALLIDGIGGATASLPAGALKFVGRLIRTGTTPTFTAGTGAGTSPTIGFTGTDTAGFLSVQTGTGPSAGSPPNGANIVTVTATVARTSPPAAVLLFPASQITATLSAAQQVHVEQSGNNWVINTGTSALVASTQYSWWYFVIDAA